MTDQNRKRVIKSSNKIGALYDQLSRKEVIDVEYEV